METFKTWATEKRDLNEVLGTLATAAAVGTGVAYLRNRRRNRKEQEGKWAIYQKGMTAPEKVTGVEVVQRLRLNKITGDTLVVPPGEQNWRKLSDAKKYLPFKATTKGQVDKDTVWFVYIDPQNPQKASNEEVAQLVSARKIQGETFIWRAGYDKPLKYKNQDVQDELKQFVDQELPSLGDTDLHDKKCKYQVNGTTYGPIPLIDLPKTKFITDATWVWVIGGGNWVKYREIKDKLPSVGQAHTATDRGILSRVGKGIGSMFNKDIFRGKTTKDDYVKKANAATNATP